MISRDRYRIIPCFAIAAGVFATDTMLFSKYLYMLFAGILCVYGVARIVTNRTPIKLLGNNRYLFYFGIYIFVLVLGKQMYGLFISGSDVPITAGLGNVIYVLGAAVLFGLYDKKIIGCFCAGFISTFCAIFLITGQWTLFDIGDECRTIAAYYNPNVLAMHSAGALFLQALIYREQVGVRRLLLLLCGGIAASAILNSGSRAMYLGIIGATVVAAAVMLFRTLRFHKRLAVSKTHIKKAAAAACVFLVATSIFAIYFSPKPENAIIDVVHDIDKTSASAWKLITGTNMPDNDLEVPTTGASKDPVIGFDRFSDKSSSEPSSILNNRRFAIWQRYFEKLPEYWLLGVGPNEEGIFFHEFFRIYVPHNTLIDVIYKYGLIAFLLFVIVLWKCVSPLFKRKLTFTQLISVLGFISCMIYALLHDATDYPIFWCVIALTLRISDHSGKAQNIG